MISFRTLFKLLGIDFINKNVEFDSILPKNMEHYNR